MISCRLSEKCAAPHHVPTVQAPRKRPVSLRSLNGVPLVLWAARKPVQAINARLLPIRYLSWQAPCKDSI